MQTTQGKKRWLNKRCRDSFENRNKAWNRVRKRPSERAWYEYEEARNEYVKIRREEEMNYEKDIVSKCKSEPKLFYNFVNDKMKVTDGILRLVVDGKSVESEKEICEQISEKLQSVFDIDDVFVEPASQQITPSLLKIEFDLKELMRTLDVRKAIGCNGIAGWILRECTEQLLMPIYDIIRKSLNQGELPKEWRRANIVPIFKGGKREDPLNYRPVSLTSIVCKL